MGRPSIDNGPVPDWADSKRDVAVKATTGRIFVIAIVPILIVTGFWNWTRDQVRSEPVNTVPHQQSSAEAQMSPVGVSSFRRVSPAIVAWEERRHRRRISLPRSTRLETRSASSSKIRASNSFRLPKAGNSVKQDESLQRSSPRYNFWGLTSCFDCHRRKRTC